MKIIKGNEVKMNSIVDNASIEDIASVWRACIPCGNCPFIRCCDRTDCEENFIEFMYELIKGED